MGEKNIVIVFAVADGVMTDLARSLLLFNVGLYRQSQCATYRFAGSMVSRI